MSQVFDEDGKMIPVTLVQAVPNKIERIKNNEKDGYSAYVVKTPNKTLEFRFENSEKAEFEAGKDITVEIFEKGEKVEISGISKGKGFQGVVKRHGFKGGPASHGHKHNLRQPGSSGSIFPMHVIKGKRMAGRMGSDKVTLRGIKVMEVISEDNALALKGALPGRKGSYISITN